MGRLDNPVERAELVVQVNALPVVTYFAHIQYPSSERWAKLDVGDGLGAHGRFYSFKVGEGGWVLSNGVQVRREPEPWLSRLDCQNNAYRYPTDGRYVFSKNLLVTDLHFDAPRTARAECVLLTSEANNDGYGNPPEFWEAGVYDSAGRIILYATFDKIVKDVSKKVTLSFRLIR